MPRAPLTLCPSAPSPPGSGSIYPVPSCVKHGLSKATVVLSAHSGALPPPWWLYCPPSCSSLQPGSDRRTLPSLISALAGLPKFIPRGPQAPALFSLPFRSPLYFIFLLFLNFIQSSAGRSLAAVSLGQRGQPGLSLAGFLHPDSCTWTWAEGLRLLCCGPVGFLPPGGGTEGLGLGLGGHQRTRSSRRETVEAPVTLLPASDPSCWEL